MPDCIHEEAHREAAHVGKDKDRAERTCYVASKLIYRLPSQRKKTRLHFWNTSLFLFTRLLTISVEGESKLSLKWHPDCQLYETDDFMGHIVMALFGPNEEGLSGGVLKEWKRGFVISIKERRGIWFFKQWQTGAICLSYILKNHCFDIHSALLHLNYIIT